MSELSKVDMAKSMVQAYADKNWGELWSLADPRIVYDETATGRKTQGNKVFLKILQGWGAAFPDSKITVKNTKTFGNTVIFDLHWTGTHEGIIDTPGGEILPTGKKIDLSASMVIEIGEREVGVYEFGVREARESEVGPPRVITVTHFFDMAAMEKQIGLTKEEMAS